jgi:hypothetical protein
VLGSSPIIFSLVLKLNYNRLARPSVKRAIGTIYLSIKENTKVALAYSSIFMLRRLVFIALTFGISDQPGLQIIFFSYLNLAYIIYLGLVMPHDTVSMTSSELVNESILMMTCYHFILFAGLVYDVEAKTSIGWSLAAFVALLLVFNVAVILFANIRQFRAKFTLWKLRRKANKKRD